MSISTETSTRMGAPMLDVQSIVSERKERTNATLASEVLRAFETIRHHAWKVTLQRIDEGDTHMVLSGFHTLFELRAALIGAMEAREERQLAPYRFSLLCHLDPQAIHSNKSANPYVFQPPVVVPTMVANYATSTTIHTEKEAPKTSLATWYTTLQAIGANGFLFSDCEDPHSWLEDYAPVCNLPVAFLTPEASQKLTEATENYRNQLYVTITPYERPYWDRDVIPPQCYLTHPHALVKLGAKEPPIIVGQNLNPSCFRRLHLDPTAAPITPEAIAILLDEAQKQVEDGASLLNVNLGPLENTTRERAILLEEREKVEATYRNYPYYYHKAYLPLADSKIRAMANLVYGLVTHLDCPLAMDTSRVDVLETALKLYPGRLLVNSITDHPTRTDQLLPLVKKYGAAMVIMPIADRKPFPKNAAERCTIAKDILLKALAYGITRRDVVFDAITLPATLATRGVRETLDTLDLFRDTFHSPTILGIANLTSSVTDQHRAIFQQRQFLTMALSHGLSAALLNPCAHEVRDAFLGAKHLLGYETPEARYLYRDTSGPAESES